MVLFVSGVGSRVEHVKAPHSQRCPVGQVLAEIDALLDACDPDIVLSGDAEQLGVVAGVRRVAGRLQTLAATLAAGVDAGQVADRQVGVPLASWLAATQQTTRTEAHRLIGQGRDLTRFPTVAAAALAGVVGFDQARAIAGVLVRLPDDLDAKVAEAEQMMLSYAADFDSAGLGRLSRHLVEVLDPDGCDARDAQRLERDLKAARAARHLTFTHDGHGTVQIRGSLPHLAAEPFITLINAYTLSDRQAGLDRLDPLAETMTPAKRRADALCALIAAHQQQGLAPSCGGDRPRVVVTLNYDRLRDDCIRAGVLGTDQPITAGELRQLACDADLLPAVLGGNSEILDVGRTHRLVTPAIRTALDLRDGGCVFPGCDKPPTACHAHHLVPWWNGGDTALSNLALVCPHHHNLVEPARHGPPGRRWEVRISAEGIPEVLPPNYVDEHRRPRRHQRLNLRAA